MLITQGLSQVNPSLATKWLWDPGKEILPLRAGLSPIQDGFTVLRTPEGQGMSGQEPQSHHIPPCQSSHSRQTAPSHPWRLGLQRMPGLLWTPALSSRPGPTLGQPEVPASTCLPHLTSVSSEAAASEPASSQRHLKPTLPPNREKGLSPPPPGEAQDRHPTEDTTDEKAPARARLEAGVT